MKLTARLIMAFVIICLSPFMGYWYWKVAVTNKPEWLGKLLTWVFIENSNIE